jgi:M3 family oligoendopeptidase
MDYKHYKQRPESLTAEFIQAEFDILFSKIEEAENYETPEKWISLYLDWNALKSYIGSEGSRIGYEFSKDMSNKKIEDEEEYFREKVSPISSNGSSKFLDSFLKSRYKSDVGKKFGEHLIAVLETSVKPLAPINTDLNVKLSSLSNTYNKIVSSGFVTVSGEKVTLPVARSKQASSDPETRKEAFLNHRNWFLNHHDELGKIFHEMVALRHQMALNLGFKNFIELGYLSMGRTDYGPQQAKQFRDSVRKFVVPLQSQMLKKQAQELGTQTLKCWDTEYCPSCTLPVGIAPIENQLDNAEKVFDSLDVKLADYFRKMRNENLIDLENRVGKKSGAFCTSFPDEGRVAILCNSTGDQGDVGTLMHEMGHAFQGWESQPIEAIDLQWPTSDACEIHSMGMEYLALQQLHYFFSEEHRVKFSQGRWREAIGLMTYICIVDEFQHWVYENFNSTMEERDNAWVTIWKIYKPDVDYSMDEKLIYARWYSQLHIIDMPFYYIDYAIAETGAMQLAIQDLKDHKIAMEKYIRLCQIGGTKSVLEIFNDVEFTSPFDENIIKFLMDKAASILHLNAELN